MSKGLAAASAVFALSSIAIALAASAPQAYMRRAVIEHHAGTATVTADSAIPLQDAITVVREEYGWVVDYEDPPYAGTDLTVHPSPRAGVPPYRIVAGGAFQSIYSETPTIWSSAAQEQQVLEKIVSDYNQSGNPGNFAVLELPDGSFDVVGTSAHNASGAEVAITPILNTPVSIPSVPRGLAATISTILAALPARTVNFCCSGNLTALAIGGSITVGGSNVPARDLLTQVVDRMGGNWVWQLVYQPSPMPMYLFGIGPAERAEYDAFGRRRLIPVGPVSGPAPAEPQ